MKKLFVLALLATLPAQAWAAGAVNLSAKNAGELADLCGADPKAAASDAKINFCHGFAQGAIDVERHYAGDKKKWCFPTPAPTRTETMTGFAKWVQAIPTNKAYGPAEGLFKYLAERHPCK